MKSQWLHAEDNASSEPDTLEIAPFSAKYKVTTNALPLSGSGARSLKYLGDGRYRLEQIAKSFLLTRREISEFNMKQCQISPLNYRYEQTGIGRDQRHLLDFHDNGKVVYEANKQQVHIQLPDDKIIYDRLSETLALRCELIARHNQPIVSNIQLHVLNKDQIRTHDFAVVGEEILKVEKTTVNTIKLIRVRGDDQRNTQMWFAPSHNYALIKMQHTNDGKTITFNLLSMKQVF